LCRVCGVSKSGYYKWRKTKSNRYLLDRELISQIHKIQDKNKFTYGYRKVTHLINQQNKLHFNNKRVYRIMKEYNLLSRIRKKKKWYGKKSIEVEGNIINRNFISKNPYKKLVTDITEIRILNQKIYLSAILDLYNNEILSYEISNRNSLDLVLKTIKKLLSKNKKYYNNCILHSDQGFQYTNKNTKIIIKKAKMIQSMSRKGNPIDNACIESFFGVLKSELVYNCMRKYTSIEEFIKELHLWMKYYNEIRIQKKLGYLSPSKYKKVI